MSLPTTAGATVPVITTVVVQPTPFCNIDCTYCYLPQRDVKTVMQQGTIAGLFAKVFASGWAAPQLTVIWHAGEPLVLPVAFYQTGIRGHRGTAAARGGGAALLPDQRNVDHAGLVRFPQTA